MKHYSYKELQDIYNYYFSLKYLGDNFEDKIKLIGLVCLVTYRAQQVKPRITSYIILKKIAQDIGLPAEYIEGLSIICDSMMYEVKHFTDFGLEKNEIIPTIKNILNNYLPF